METFIAWLVYSVVYGSIIMMGASGETLTEKSGHLNLGVPGIMYLGGFISYYATFCYEKSTPNPNAFIVVIITITTALITGAIMGLIYSLMCVTFQCNQNVMGLVLTSFCIGFGKFLSFSVGITTNSKADFSGSVYNAKIPFLSDIPFIGPVLFGYGFMIYLTIILAVLLDLFLKKTRVGLNLRAVGESPASADAVGIHVTCYKYIGTIVGCALCGLAGMIYVLGFANGLWSTNNNIEGIGWLAVALVIFASWRPVRLIWGSILFGFLFWAASYMPTVFSLPKFTGSQELLGMLPYLVTIVVLIVNSAQRKKENQPPASLGLAYFREER
jgi:general nucleoside transport system permease protein